MTTKKQPDLIYSYPDRQAIEDGVLVAVSDKDRLTRATFDWLVETAPMGAKPPDRWPVSLFNWFGAVNTEQEFEQKAIALAIGLIGSYGQEARRIYEENIGGGIWKCHAITDKGKLAGLETDQTNQEFTERGDRCFWLLPNELGGLTLMFPEDY